MCKRSRLLTTLQNFSGNRVAIAERIKTKWSVFKPDLVATFWGEEHYERLLTIRKEIDPENISTLWDCMEWNGHDRTTRVIL